MQKIRNDIVPRQMLGTILPLNTPLRLGIDAVSNCNFKCIFCFHAIKNLPGFKPAYMKTNTFQSLIQGLDFPTKLKKITFGGLGEPLLHRNLPYMISSVKESEKTEAISIVTNGSLLNKKLSKELLEAGMDEIIISVEGLSNEKYKELCSADIDFEKFVDNIKFLYQNKKHTKIYIKILDIDDDEKEKFHKIFDPISDIAHVENVVPRYKGVDYTKIKTYNNITKRKEIKTSICSISFFSLSLVPNGNVLPCCLDYTESMVLGNINKQSLTQIWNGARLKNIRNTFLLKKMPSPFCIDCKFTQHNGRVEDLIDDKTIAKLTRHFS